jgi:MFS family permease
MRFQTSLQQAWTAHARDGQLPLGFLFTVFVANLLAFLNFSIVIVAMVPINKAFGAPEYMTLQLPCALFGAMVCAVPVTPFLLRRWGTRRLLLMAVIGLAVTTSLAALSATMWQLALVLFLNGLASAPVAPATQTAVNARMAGPDRGIGMAVWGAGMYAGGLIGPMVAGLLLDTFGWRVLFLVPLPLALLTPALVSWFLKPASGEVVSGDLASLVLAPLAILLIVTTCSFGRNFGWFQSNLAMVTLIGLLIVAPLYVVRYRKTPAPVFDLGCLRDRNAGLALILVFFVNLMGTGLYQAEFLGRISHLSHSMLGLRITVGTLALLAGMALAAWQCHSGRAGFALSAGLVLTVIAKFGFLLYDSHTGAIQAIWPAAVGGTGFGLATAALATLAYRTISEERGANVAAVFVLATFLGACLGTGVLDEVVIGVTTYDAAQGMSVAMAKQAAFKAEFWVELLGTLALLVPAILLTRAQRPRTA